MPFKVVREIPPEEFAKKPAGRGPGEELIKPYLDLVGSVPIGSGIEIEFGEEGQNATKRRITAAAKTLGKAIKWKTAPEGHLKFQVVELPPAKEESPTPKPKKTKEPTGQSDLDRYLTRAEPGAV